MIICLKRPAVNRIERLPGEEGRRWAGQRREEALRTGLCQASFGLCQTEVPRRSNQPPRQARLAIRAGRVRIISPLKRTSEHLPPITLYAVEAREENVPKGVQALHWLLLTTLPTESFRNAVEKIGWYQQRWKIERLHYILKSGCKIEDLRLETSDRLKRAITLYTVIAWRIAWTTYQARENPSLPCSVAFSKMEWQALWWQVHPRKSLPDKPPALKDAVRWLAMLGGFLGRKGDGDPGVKVLWNGLHDLNIGMRFLENT
ncbi:MAG: IS4 family transposase [Patescibacteria group bacterium]